MRQNKIHSGGFVLVEFAIALPLLILVLCALGHVSISIYKLGKDQLADYVLESEARYVMERITQVARTAKEIELEGRGSNDIKIIYHAVADATDESYWFDLNSDYVNEEGIFADKDVLETQIFVSHKKDDRDYINLYAQRQDGYYNNPITGENFFGDTKLNHLDFDLDEDKKILHISLEMESIVTEHKIKIATAVFMPGYKKRNNDE